MKNTTLSNILISVIALFSTVACIGNSNSTPNNGIPITSPIPSGNSLIFGHFYGHCQGETCIETFKISDGNLYEDKKDDYGHKSFHFEQLDNSKYNKIKTIINKVPTALLTQTEGDIGSPDYADGGGIYIQYTQGTDTKKWRIDNDLANIPADIHSFIQSIKNSIDAINTESTPVDSA